MRTTMLLRIIAFCGIYTTALAQTIPNYVPSAGLVGWWPFNGNANDMSTNNNHAAVNGAMLTTDRYGNNNNAYDCNSGYLYSPTTTNIPRSGTMSISVWFNSAADFHIGEFMCLGSHPNTYWGAVGGNNAFTVNYGRGCGSTGSSLQNIGINYGQWHHVVFVSTGTGGTARIYYDGHYFGTSITASTGGFCSTTGLYIGHDAYFNSNYPGILDDIGIWNRALTDCEISDLFLGIAHSMITSHPNSQTVNSGDNVQLVVGASDPGATFQWQINTSSGFLDIYNSNKYSGTTNDTLTIYGVEFNNNEVYQCIVISAGCSEISKSATLTVTKNDVIPDIEMPNIFTPNNDGVNDNFIPIKYKGISNASLEIFNRWGQKVYSTTSPLQGWNGYYKDQLCPDGTYFWLIKYVYGTNEVNEIKGFLTLLR